MSGQHKCWRNSQIRIRTDPADNTPCKGTATVIGKTAVVAATMTKTPPVEKAALTTPARNDAKPTITNAALMRPVLSLSGH
jgi:hypothetical protein